MQVFRVISMLAWRNLWRNYRRTVIMIAAISIGVWAMIFMTALIRGMVDDMVRDGIESLPGHVQVHHPDFRDDPGINNLLPQSDSAIIEKFDAAGFRTWASRIKVPGVVTSERDSRGVTIFGIDPVRERDITFVAGSIAEGVYPDSVAGRGVVIGQKLAEVLETGLGKRIVLMSQDPGNEVADRGFRIVGIFDAKLESYEETMVFVGKESAQQMLKVPDRVNEVVVMGDDYRDVGPLTEQVAMLVGPDVEVLPWNELDNYLGSMLAVMDGFVLVWMIVIFLALSFGLVNTLVMAVFERVREIGLMLALGMHPRNILGQIVIESLLLLTIGLVIGNVLAWITIMPLRDGIDISAVAQGMEMFGASSVLYPVLNSSDMLLASLVVLVLGFLASLSPAWQASRYEPIEAITKVYQ